MTSRAPERPSQSARNRARAGELHAEAARLDTCAEQALLQDFPEALSELHLHVNTRVAPRRAQLYAIAQDRCPAAARLYAEADLLYWRIVDLYRGFVMREASFHARKSRRTVEDAQSVLTEAAFHAAVNWCPTQGAYTTFSAYALRASWQRCNERQDVVDVGDSRAIRAKGGFGRALVDSLDAPRPEGMGPRPERRATQLSQDDLLDLLEISRALRTLPVREQIIVEEWASGAKDAKTAETMGLTRARVHQLRHEAMNKIRVAVLRRG